MKIKNVTIAGGGTLGIKIRMANPFKGFDVTVYDAYDKRFRCVSKSFRKAICRIV